MRRDNRSLWKYPTGDALIVIITSEFGVISGVVVVHAPSTLNNSPSVQTNKAGRWIGSVTVGWSIDPQAVESRLVEGDERMTVGCTFVEDVCEQIATIFGGDFKPVKCGGLHNDGTRLCTDVG
jgi:hypothetical protein